MAVALDALMLAGNSADGLNQQATGVTSISSTGITVVSASFLGVVVHSQNNTAAITNLAGTWNSIALTKQIQADNTAALNKATSAILTGISPASGANTLACSWTTATDIYMSAVSFNGTDVVTGVDITHNVSGTSGTTVTVTSTTDGATIGNWGTNGSTPTVNFNKIYAEAPLAPGGGATYQLSGTSNAHTFTGAGGTNPAWTGVHVLVARGITIGNTRPTSRFVGSPAQRFFFKNRTFLPDATAAVSASITVTPGTASLVLTGFAPTVQTPRLVTPGTASLVITGFAPSVILGTVVTPGKASLVLTGFAPTVLTPRLVTPGKASLVLTGFAPIVTVGGSLTVTPGTASLVLTGFAPTVLTPRLVTPGTASLILTGFAPTVIVGVIVVNDRRISSMLAAKHVRRRMRR